MTATSIIAIVSTCAAAAVFWIVWRTGTRIRRAIDVITTQSLAEATQINDKLEVIRLDVNSNLTAALEHIEILKDELVKHGINLPAQDPRV